MSAPYYADSSVTLHHGDCLDVLRELPDASVDAVVTDPPYGLGFMGKEWDDLPPGLPFAAECLRVLKPGGHMLAFGGTRTWHRLACAVEDAGFEVRDSIAWLYGSGFPKSLDVSKAIDARATVNAETKRRIVLVAEVIRTHREAKGMERAAVSLAVVGTPSGACWNWEHQQLPSVEMWPAIKRVLDIPDEFDGLIEGDRAQFIAAERAVIAERKAADRRGDGTVVGLGHSGNADITAPATDAARTWQGWGTALKPAHEPVVVGRKPEDVRAILAKIGSHLDALEDACRQRVSGAASSSRPTRRDSHEATTGSAPASAATRREGDPERTTRTGAAVASSEAMATSASALTVETFLSTVTSWKACLVELSDLTSTCTTSTTTSRTTDLRTLSSCLSSLTQSVMAQSTPEPRSWSSLVTAADNLFAAGVLNLRSTLALSAAETATASTPHASPDAGGSSPAFEPVVVARKPLGAGTVAANVLAHGTGALNIDGCRVDSGEAWGGDSAPSTSANGYGPDDADGWQGTWTKRSGSHTAGRWPANVVLDEAMAGELDQQSGESVASSGTFRRKATLGVESDVNIAGRREEIAGVGHGDAGGASRFMYVAKADASERVRVNGTAHPTVKPLALMRWLVRLVTPPGGTVLEPFAGSGTTVEACILEGFRCVAIEREADYLPLIRQRINRRRDPVEAVKATGDDGGLFDLLDGGAA